MWTALLWATGAAILTLVAAYLVNQLPQVHVPPWVIVVALIVVVGMTGFFVWRQNPRPIQLTLADFTVACRGEYRNPNAVARLAPIPGELPSYWVKCFDGEFNLGGFSIELYCNDLNPGMHAYNPARTGPEEDEPWLRWQCAPS
jgi:hypothetical protein